MWEVYIKMLDYNVGVSDVDRVIDQMLCFKSRAVSHERAKLALETALIGAIRHGFSLEDLDWPMMLTRPDSALPEKIADKTYSQLRNDIADVISFTWTADCVHAGTGVETRLHCHYDKRPAPKELVYGLCQYMLAEGVFGRESSRSLIMRRTVAGWFKPGMVTNEWELKALVCLINYFQDCSRSYLYPPLEDYLRSATPQRVKMHREIVKLMRKVDWTKILNDREIMYLEWSENPESVSDDDKDNAQYILNVGWESLIF